MESRLNKHFLIERAKNALFFTLYHLWQEFMKSLALLPTGSAGIEEI